MVGDCPNYTIHTSSIWVWHGLCVFSASKHYTNQKAETVILEFVNRGASILTQITFYDVTPAWATIAVAEVLITGSLCVLLYDYGSGSGFPRTKRLLNTLVVYAVNRCLLTSLVAIADLVIAIEVQDPWSIGLDFVIGKLYANSLLASLNSRKHLRSQDPGTVSDQRTGIVHFANPTKLSGDAESSKDETGQLNVSEMAVIDIIADPALDRVSAFRREEEV